MSNSKYVLGNAVIDELIKHGIADQQTQRVIIDIPIDGFPVIYTQRIGTNTLFDIVALLGGAKIGSVTTHTNIVQFEKSTDEHK